MITYLSNKEIVSFFSSISELDPFSLRDKTIFELMYSSGLQAEEVLALKIEDIDLHKRTIAVKTRVISLGEEGYRLLSKYLNEARENICSNKYSSCLFIRSTGENLDMLSILRLLKKYAAAIHIDTPISLLTLRNSCAKHLLENGVDITTVNELLGVKNSKSFCGRYAR